MAELAAASDQERGDLVDRYPSDVLRRWADLHQASIQEWRLAAMAMLR